MCVGVYLSTLHVFSGFRYDIQLHPSGYPGGDILSVYVYPHCGKPIHFWGSNSDLFLVDVVLQQDCPLSMILFLIAIDRISRCTWVAEGFCLGGFRISSLLFVDDVFLLASSGDALHHALEVFASEYETARIRMNTSKSDTMVLNRKRLVRTLDQGWVAND